MKVSVKSLLACAFILTIGQTVRAEYDVNAYCTLVANGVKLASVEDCQTFYTCMNGRATIGQCPATQAYDKNTQSCRPKSDVKCYFGVDEPCIGQSGTFVPIVNTCNGYIYCKNNAEAGRGQCPHGQIFHNGACIYGNCNDNVNGGTTNEGLSSVCQIMPNNRFFGSTKNCQIWQVCRDTGLTQGSCDSDYVFDVQNSNCNFKTANMCARVTGQDIQPDPAPATKCKETEKGTKKADPSKCSSYSICDGTYWTTTPCAAGMFYSVDEQKCLSRQEATPAKDCNRCEGTKRQFVNAVDPTCRKYWVCSNGFIQSSGNCAADSYFDEATQACILDKNGLKDYAKVNGACKASGDDDDNSKKCADTCKALSGADCKKVGECECGLNGTTCEVCQHGYEDGSSVCKASECGATCEALEADKCVATDGCKCGLTGTACGVCPVTVDPATKKCATCKAYCEGLTTCAANDDCQCGKEGGKCTECAEGVDGSGECKVDCAAECKLLAGDECKPFGTCSCGFHSGVCADCDKTDCNTCVCKAATPACVDDKVCECYEDTAGKCISCPNGVNGTGDDCEK